MPPFSLPLVSIVTPAYNQGEYLSETIDSVLAQDYPNIEYIVLDDGSTDSTPEVMARYASRVRGERQANMGQSNTLNKGWAASRGAYLGYVSSDDRLLPHAVSALVTALEANPHAAVAYGDFNLIDEHGRFVKVVESPEYDHRAMVEELICQPGAGALFRREVFERAGGWNPALRKIPDFEFWLRASRCGPFVRVARVLADYRVHAESTAVRPIPHVQSMEIVAAMSGYWGEASGPAARRSMSRAHFKAARSHAQSGRVGSALRHFALSARLQPSQWVSPAAWRGLASALLMRLTYRFGAIAAHLR